MDFDRLRRNWVNLGRKDPMWAVATEPDKAGGRWDEGEFYATGVASVEWFGSWCGLHGIDVPKGDALDFGCGVGRITFALAAHFDTVTGVDVSAPMLEFARERNRFGDRVRFVENTVDDLAAFADGSFACAMSVLVLQHMRADYQYGYLRELLRVLEPGGLLFFQTAVDGAAPDKLAATDEGDGEAQMEIHCVDRARVHELLAAGGGTVLREEPDRWAGERWDSVHVAVRKG